MDASCRLNGLATEKMTLKDGLSKLGGKVERAKAGIRRLREGDIELSGETMARLQERRFRSKLLDRVVGEKLRRLRE